MANILVVDDERPIRESIEMFLSEKGHVVRTAPLVADGLTAFQENDFQVVILDIRFPDGSGLDALRTMQSLDPLPKIIMITAFQDMETTIEAMKRGAYDYIHKPLDADELEKCVDEAIESYSEDKNRAGQAECPGRFRESDIVGRSAAMKEIYKIIGMLCRNRATALITGETGTGKELVARRIHLSGPDCSHPFVTFDCSAVVDTLLESELFGHTKGAFTGAVTDRPGRIEQAGDGTLFLDEVGELPLNLQGKLLGFLERKTYTRVGGKTLRNSRCRIIAATNRNLEKMVGQKRFRQDLFFRLKVVTIPLPPLRKRLADIPDLAVHFTQKSALELGLPPLTLQDGCIRRLERHPWTGNVRELENIILSAAIRSRGSVILADTIDALLSRPDNTGENTGENTALSLAQAEQHHIRIILDSVGWHKTRAADILEISLPTLRKKIQKYGLAPPEK